MIDTTKFRRVGLVAGALVLAACHGLLDVSDPTLVRDSDIANASGANAQRINASSLFGSQLVKVVRDVAYFTDEWMIDGPASAAGSIGGNRKVQLDLRNSEAIEAIDEEFDDEHLGPLTKALWQTSIAIPAVRAYTPDSLRGDFLSQLYGIRGYLILQMAEDLCPGFPINDVVNEHTVYGGPMTTDSALAYASSQLDSAVAYAGDSVRFVTLARVAKGRVLLDQGKYAEAAAVVAPVPTTGVYAAEGNSVIVMDDYFCTRCFNAALGDREGTTGQPFASAQDPRVPTEFVGMRQTNSADSLFVRLPDYTAAARIVIATGVEARLIEAEAALHSNGDWKSILDALRATVGLPSLVDPGTADGRVDLLYRERAFWLLMSGRRLGDLRRLIRNYGRAPETVFPTGVWQGGTGDSYGTATAIPFVFANQRKFNPYITTGCTAR